jgi:hypothetical protein
MNRQRRTNLSLAGATSLLMASPSLTPGVRAADFDLNQSGSITFTSRVGAVGRNWGTRSDSKDDEQIQELIKIFETTLDSWSSMREKLETLRNLPVDWNTFGSGPIPDQTIENALKLIDDIGGAGGNAEWVEPTSDGAIVLQSHFANSIVRFEIDDTEMVGVAIQNPRTAPVYDDILLADVATCLGSDRVR